MRRFYFSLALAFSFVDRLWGAEDPFYGKWKLNMGQSQFARDQIKIQDLGDNKYKWTVGNRSDTITFDGSDQPVHFGRTISMVAEGQNNWKMVIKKDGRVLSSMTHTISEDGKNADDQGDGNQARRYNFRFQRCLEKSGRRIWLGRDMGRNRCEVHFSG